MTLYPPPSPSPVSHLLRDYKTKIYYSISLKHLNMCTTVTQVSLTLTMPLQTLLCIGGVAIVGFYFLRSDRISRFSSLYTIIHLYIYDNSQIVFTPVEIIVTAANQLFLVFVVWSGLGCRFIRVLVTITFINLMDLLYFHITMTQWKKQTLLMETSYILFYAILHYNKQ